MQSSELSVGGVTFRFLNGEAILDENMLFWVRLYAVVYSEGLEGRFSRA